MEIKIKDFNIIKDIDLELKPGFTVIQGPSNSGKSSIIKAIENCIFNQSGTVNVRHGCKNYSVGIKKDDHTVSLVKGKDTKYKVDDVIYEKIGVSQLAEVAEALNIRETVLGGEKVRLNFSKQMSYPFLLDKTPGQLYRFIVDSSESESLSNVLKDIARDTKDLDKSIIQNEAQIDVLTKQQIQLNENLKGSDEILEVSNKILELDTECNQINNILMLHSKYRDLISSIDVLRQTYNRLNVSFDTVSLDQLKDNYEKTSQLVKSFNNLVNEKTSLVYTIQNLSININTKQIDDMLDDYKNSNNLYQTYIKALESVTTFEDHIKDLTIQIDEEKQKLSKFDVCPLCGNSINKCKEGA